MPQPSKQVPIPPILTDDEAGREFFVQYTRHARQLYRFIRTLVPNQSDAEDAFQDVSATLWQKFDQFEPGTNFSAWALQMARYRVLNLRQQQQRRAACQLSDEVFDAVADEAAEMHDLLERQHGALADCYQRLTVANRELIDNRYRMGTSVKDLATQLRRPLRTVYRLLDRIHSNLLECIERRLSAEERGN